MGPFDGGSRQSRTLESRVRMTAPETIFDPAWLANVPTNVRRTDPFVHRLARENDAHYASIRGQLESSWAEIPEKDRPATLLGLLRSKQDAQHERARDVLFAGTALARLGWGVEWEASVADGKTPDFRLRKKGVEILAEAVTPEVASVFPGTKDTLRFREALDKLETDFGIWVSELVFERDANPDEVRQYFLAEIDKARANQLDEVRGTYDAPGARIQYRLQRWHRTLSDPYLGTEALMYWGTIGRDELRAAVVKKIRKYQRPLIVITGVPAMPIPDFEALDEAMFGSESVTFHRNSNTTSNSRSGGLMIEDGEDGDLIRKHLVGVLGVRLDMPWGATRYKLRLHLFHAQENQDELASAFLPVPQTVLRPNGARMDLIRIGESSWSIFPGG
jgi:hypothetical protein